MTDKQIPLGDLSINFAAAILKTVQELGYSSEGLIKQYGLQSAFLNTSGARISIPKFMRIGHDAIALTKTRHLGLLMGKHFSLGDLGLSGFAAMTATDIAAAFHTLIEYETLTSRNSRGRSRFYLEDGRGVCHFYSISPYNSYNYFVVDSSLSTWFHLARTLGAQGRIAHHIEIEHTMSAYKEAYESLFSCPVYFGCERNALVLTQSCTQDKSLFANPASHHEARQICEQQRDELQAGKTLVDRVTELITERLSGASPSIEEIAAGMGIAGWTLRRRLQDEGAQFREILDATRHALALSYVRDTEHNYTEIAFLLGFSTPAAFQRAFKRWTKMSPGKFRTHYLQTRSLQQKL